MPAARMRPSAGCGSLHARGTEFEREYPFGIVRQCLQPVVRRDAERERLLQGAARLAEPVLVGVPENIDVPPPGLLHGLYWLVANLADETPLALVVDDAHWADEPSLRFLAYLARRVDALRIAVVIGARRDDDPGGGWRAGAGGDPRARRAQPARAGAAGAAGRRAPAAGDQRRRGRRASSRARVTPRPAATRSSLEELAHTLLSRRRAVRGRLRRARRHRRTVDGRRRRCEDARAAGSAADVAGPCGRGARRRLRARPRRAAGRAAGRRRCGRRRRARANRGAGRHAGAALSPPDPRRRGPGDAVGARAGGRSRRGRRAAARARSRPGADRAAAAARRSARRRAGRLRAAPSRRARAAARRRDDGRRAARTRAGRATAAPAALRSADRARPRRAGDGEPVRRDGAPPGGTPLRDGPAGARPGDHAAQLVDAGRPRRAPAHRRDGRVGVARSRAAGRRPRVAPACPARARRAGRRSAAARRSDGCGGFVPRPARVRTHAAGRERRRDRGHRAARVAPARRAAGGGDDRGWVSPA